MASASSPPRGGTGSPPGAPRPAAAPRGPTARAPWRWQQRGSAPAAGALSEARRPPRGTACSGSDGSPRPPLGPAPAERPEHHALTQPVADEPYVSRRIAPAEPAAGTARRPRRLDRRRPDRRPQLDVRPGIRDAYRAPLKSGLCQTLRSTTGTPITSPSPLSVSGRPALDADAPLPKPALISQLTRPPKKPARAIAAAASPSPSPSVNEIPAGSLSQLGREHHGP